MKIRCGDCKWFDDKHEGVSIIKPIQGKSVLGFCRKHFPVVFNSQGFYYGGWPAVDTEDFCGEFKSKD